VFSPPEAERLRQVQNTIQRGETVLVWTAVPFLLDFGRNRILSASEPGFANPWLRFPAGISEDALVQYLRSWGVRYVLFEADGYAIKSISDLKPYLNSEQAVYRKLGDYGIYAKQALLDLAEKRRVIYRHDHMILFDLASEKENVVEQSPRGSGG